MDKKIKILIAEDEKAIAGALNLKLNHEGFETKIALNGKEAVSMLESEKFDLLILDLIMPQLDGFGVLAEIKQKGIKTPVIVASNLSQPEDIEKARGLDGIGMLRALRQDAWGKNAKVILLTNLSDEEKVSEAMELKTFDYLIKTDLSLVEVVKKIKEKLDIK